MNCPYCKDGNMPTDGWHTVQDSAGFNEPYKVACMDHPPAMESKDAKPASAQDGFAEAARAT